MKALYFDCKAGICGDMIRSALIDLGINGETVEKELKKLPLSEEEAYEHRSYAEIKGILEGSHIGRKARQIALAIYEVIAKAEAIVHGDTPETVEFHEIGRNEAIRNIAAIGICMEALNVSEVYCSELHDGRGFIECSHGRVPVPVPAVMAMRGGCKLEYVQEEINTEMVTPTGLAALIGMGAVGGPMPRGETIAEGVGCGSRDTGRGGLTVTLLEI